MKIGLVSYLNSYPYRYGLEIYKIDFQTFVPSAVADALKDGIVDVGLVPVVESFNNENWQFALNYGIAAHKRVKTVLLASNKPIEEIKKIELDTDSRTSNALCKVLFKNFYKQNVDFVQNENADAQVLIGDKTFGVEKKFKFIYDLSEEWHKFTNLPFVFAVWISNKELKKSELYRLFKESLEYGIGHLKESVEEYKNIISIPQTEALDYLQNYICYPIGAEEIKAIDLFRELYLEL